MKRIFLLLVFFASTAAGQTYPSRPVRWIVPFPPGGATDILARIVAQKMTESWGVAVVVENRAGAAGAIGSEAVAKAAPDGYTILMGTTSTHAVNPAINPKLPYDNLADFTAVTLVATFPNVLVAHPSTASSLPELIARLKANPGKYNFGSSGAGSSTHLTGELFKLMTQTDINHIPYKGTGPLLNDLMAGHVSFAFDQITAVMSAVQAGKMRALGVASLERNAALPDVPAIAEVLPGFEATAWVGIFSPARTPGEITNRIQSETRRILQLPEIAQRMRELGATPVANAPAEFSAFVQKDTRKWRELVQAARIKIEQ
ncbi:MAG: tripartite tricarboxylate transporter substrate binding protein [Betaproteobacteria bacterium]|nr:MAG: tripartite tricarboxylate transporter substrate binding protein [Betaproteobacteria bacterium]